MRLFLAIKPDLEAQEKLYKQIQTLPQNSNLKPVKLQDLHITLQFFGEVEDSRINELICLINDNLDTKDFKIKTQNSIFFPKYGDTKIIGIKCFIPDKEFQSILKLNKKCVQFNFSKEERRFIPHITIFRVNGVINKDNYNISTNIDFCVKKLDLIKSDLTPSGPIYTTIKEFKLK
ncbi:MAG TPA: RNA 2',3'-cyclic phosphodiesterase [bacterium]|jgi:2'-5' RNA ligase|nr:RNA 2',3'-cyclic phosphodiesterase [bacterium]HOG37909.1 RNA 2',3'-cyclic phosphodiesterase [bacterium]HQI02967.1 RNA 2',3'-cyclic phosphodiesterase [bacterium]